MIQYLRHLNRQRNLKTKILKTKIYIYFLLFSLKRKKTCLNLSNSKNVIILMHGKGLGDSIIISGFLKLLKLEGFNISILAEERIAFFFRANPNIDRVIPFDKNIPIKNNFDDNLSFDLLIDPFLPHMDFILGIKIILALQPKHAVGLDMENIKCYDHSIKYKQYKSHIINRFFYIARYLNINVDKLPYDVHIPQKEYEQAKEFVNNFAGKTIIVFNPYASCKRRSFSEAQINTILSDLSQKENTVTIIIGEQHKINTIPTYSNVVVNTMESFFSAASIVKLADLIVSVDTSIGHLAAAFSKEIICVYSNEIDGKYINNYVWGPNNENALQLLSPKESAADFDTNILMNHINQKLLE